MGKSKISRKELVSAYKELDKVVGVDPAIEYDGMSDEEFEKELWKTYLELEVSEEDPIEKKSAAVFATLVEKYGDELPEEDEEEEETDDDEEEETDDDEEEETDDDDEEEEEEEPVKPVKGKGKKEPEKPAKKEKEPVKAEKTKAKKEPEKPVKKEKEQEKPAKKEKEPVKAEKAKGKEKPAKKEKEAGEEKPNQTTLIRTMIRKKKDRESIIQALSENFDKTLGWASNRLKMYEKAYGDMGKNDKQL